MHTSRIFSFTLLIIQHDQLISLCDLNVYKQEQISRAASLFRDSGHRSWSFCHKFWEVSLEHFVACRQGRLTPQYTRCRPIVLFMEITNLDLIPNSSYFFGLWPRYSLLYSYFTAIHTRFLHMCLLYIVHTTYRKQHESCNNLM